ncbi:MAG: VPDSG-CTERM sorting domain-containing protein [Opitutus sp.]
MTFQNTGTESGAVGVNSSGVTITGSSVAYFNGVLAAGPTNEQTGSGNNTYTLAQLGTNTFSNVVLIFNGSEPQNAAATPITLDALSLNIFSATGMLLGSFGTNTSTEYLAFPGVGNAGFAYKLDAAQAALANALITPANASTLRIGGAARASDASGGLETVFISTLGPGQPSTRVPDSGATVAMLGLGMGLVGCIRRFLR